MFNKLSVWKIWGLALSLIAFDIVLIALFFSRPSVLGVDESQWDFRIAELRELDSKPQTAVAGVEISRESIDSEPTPTQNPIQKVVNTNDTPVMKPWQMPFGSLFGTNGTTEADKAGKIL